MARAQKRMERILKGAANHRRLEMLELLDRQTNLSLQDIVVRLGIDYKTASEHTRKLALGGLLWKQHEGRIVRHSISPRGRSVLTFCRSLK